MCLSLSYASGIDGSGSQGHRLLFFPMPDTNSIFDKPICEQVRDTYEAAIRNYWGKTREHMVELGNFLAGDRYENDNGAFAKDRRLVQIRGQEIQDTIRHIAAEATKKPRSIETRPIDKDDDPEAGEAMGSLVENELSNPWKGFESIYEGCIIDCRSLRLGMATIDWDPECGEFGELLFRRIAPDKGMWEPSFEDPHHPLCPWFHEEKRLDVDIARKLYKAPWLEPDNSCFASGGEYKPGVPLLHGSDGSRLPGVGCKDDNKVTLWLHWRKNDKTMNEPKESAYDELEPQERYLSCVSGCGYRSPVEQDSVDQGLVEAELPELVPQGCPTCGGDLERIDAMAKDEHRLAYSKGKRLIIMAPFCANPADDKPLYDGAWPIPKARSFPLLVMTAYQKPGVPCGPCDVDYMWDQQVASDKLATLAVQRVFEHRNYWELPSVGINDAKGKRFSFREDQFNVMYRDMTKHTFGPSPVIHHEGTGLDNNWSTAYNAVQSKLTQYRGVTDLGFTPESSKNIAASTVAQLTQQGEVPTAHFNRRKNRSLSQFYGVCADYISFTYTPQRLSRLNMDGMDMLVTMWGDDLPNYDFVITDSPDFTGLEKARSEAFQVLLQTALNPMTAPFLDLFAEMNNMPRSVVRKIEKRQAEMAMEAQQAAVMGLPPPGMDQGMGGDPNMAPPPDQGTEQGADNEGAPQMNGIGM